MWYKVKTGLSGNQKITLMVSYANKVSANSAFTAMAGDTAFSLAITNNLVSIFENSKLENLVSFYPNPATQEIILQSDLNEKINYLITDIFGRNILSGDFIQSKQINISSLASGIYLLQFESAGFKTTKKVVVE